jgi:apolipoprotein N-acyltransferase
MSKFKFLLFSSFSGLLMSLAWPAIGNLSLLMCFALFPLLWVEEQLSQQGRKKSPAVFLNACLAFLVFNLLTTWWIYFASDWGAAMAICCNALFMAIVFYLFHLTRVKVGDKEGYVGLLVYWLAFEYIHLNWELSWPWLTFGNVFANSPSLIQWYEYTGVLGGSLLVLAMNLFFFLGLKGGWKKKSIRFRYWAFGIILLLLSTSWSYNLYTEQDETGISTEAVIVQPNIDPYFDKFQGIPASEQIDRMIRLAREQLTEQTELLVLPETAIPEPAWEHALEYQYATQEFRRLIEDYPGLRVVVGMLSSRLFLEGDSAMPLSAKKLPGEGYYDNYNSAMQLDSSLNIQIHRKSKLVLGAEKIPFMNQLPWMKKLSVSLGGTTGRYGTQEQPTVFFDNKGEKGLAPIICYESVYGEYVNQYQQASVYAVITNDGWWDNTPGYQQHLAYARLRAIEGRRYLLRSANTGISALILPSGDITTHSEWWEAEVLKVNFYFKDSITFYKQYGDFIGRIAAFIAPLLLLLTLVRHLNKTGQRLKAKKS